MPRPRRIPQTEETRIKALYRSHPQWSATQLWIEDGRKYSRSKYEQWVREVGRHLPPLSIDQETELTPWGEGWGTTSEEIATLFRLRAVCLKYPQYRMTPSVRNWALKLAKMFAGGSFRSFDIELIAYATDYALREAACQEIGQPMFTDDLDGQITFRIWESPENHREWLNAVEAGTVPQANLSQMMADEGFRSVSDYEHYLWMLVAMHLHIAELERTGEMTDTARAVKEDNLAEFDELMKIPNAQKAWERIAAIFKELNPVVGEENAREPEATFQG